ncbi:MAG TPA: class I SAM-dependent methyltransferase [Candidatus Limnocylindria bacterium]|nr:class I SAM-dependent methyltransferase [Candidatus Limnocylindria bacterium]
MSSPIDEQAVGRGYARWFLHAPSHVVVRYLFSRRGLWVLNTPYRRLLSAAEITATDRVLDVGCGLASLLIALAERIPFQSPAVGIDVSEELIQQAAREVRRAGLEDRITVLASRATRLPFADGAFDVVFSSHVIKHLDDQALGQAFAEIARVLKPGGRFLFWEFRKTPRSALLFWSARTTGLPPPFRLRTDEDLRTALDRAGFRQIHRISTGFFLMPPVPRTAFLATKALD